METTTKTMLEAALETIAQGFKVFPVKPDKKPYTEHGFKDSTQIQLRVKEFWTQYPNAGIGVPTDGKVVVDVDLAHGGMESKAAIEAKYGTLPKTRTHRTGGGGLHYIYNNPNGRKIRNTVALGGYSGIDIRADGGYIVFPPSPHTSGNRYELIDDSPIAPAPDWLVDLATSQRMLEPSQRTDAIEAEPIPEGQRNPKLASLAGTMRRKGMPLEAIEAALLVINKNQCSPPLPDTEVKAIAESISRYSPNGNNVIYISNKCSLQNTPEANRYKNVTKNVTTTLEAQEKICNDLMKKGLEWVKNTSGWWETAEFDRDLGLTTTQQKNYRRLVFHRLKEQGVIEQHPKINKQFRYINTKATSLEYKTATNAGFLLLQWPLGIESKVNLYPGNLVVVAGSTNAGKTAFLIHFIYLNQGNFPIYYWCSEMGEKELRDRLDKFPGMDINEWTFKAFDRSTDFADVIVPDAINIVDFLEMTDELYRVNTHLTSISHKLGSGLGIVALQKKEKDKWGRGQEFSAEKSKLYLSLDKGRLEIAKGKSWATKNVDPNGLKIDFKILNGCQFKESSEWYWEKGGV